MQPKFNLSNKPTKLSVLALLNAGELNKAYQQATALLDTSPSPLDAEIQYVYGLTRLMSGEYKEAITWLEKAVSQRPNDAVFTSNLGVAYLRNKEAENAVKYLRKAVNLKPEYEQAKYNLGSAYIEDKQAKLAIEQ